MARELVRQGGRSARIQQEVHAAVRALLLKHDRGDLTVPLIAEHAGVTPSTIYRRWGDLGQLLADVAVERLRPIAEPDNTGRTDTDLQAFVLQYAEEFSSKVGRDLLRDVIAESDSDTAALKCCRYTAQHIQTIANRAAARGETGFDVAQVIDQVIAPICYHILFADRDVSADYCLGLLSALDPGRAKAAA